MAALRQLRTLEEHQSVFFLENSNVDERSQARRLYAEAPMAVLL